MANKSDAHRGQQSENKGVIDLTHRHLSGATFISLALMALATTAVLGTVLAQPTSATAPQNATLNFKRGMDICAAPTQSQMQTWWINSPYWNVGIYLGGSTKYCTNDPNLTAQWVSNVAAQGWEFYPIWAGPQAPCIGGGISTNLTTADQQGRAEATSARNAAANLGFSGATVIFYDLEGYGAGSNQQCDDAVHAFLNAWDVMLRETYGIHPGIYGSSSGSGVQSWASLANVPDDVYIAQTGANNDAPMSVWGIPSVTDSSWKIQPPYGRHHQHKENVTEIYGGVSLYIDEVCSRGHVAGALQYGTDNVTPCPGTVPP